MAYGADKTNHIYFIRNTEGELIYIGRSANVKKRFYVHKSLTPWWDEMATSEIVMSGGHQAVFKEELRLIALHHPKHNLYGSKKSFMTYFSPEDYQVLVERAQVLGMKPHQMISQFIKENLVNNEAA